MKSNDSFMDKARNLQNRIEARRNRIGKGKYGRVLKMARNPTNEEYARTSKITGAGILLIGAIGFLIYIIKELAVPHILEFFGY